jgi:hypothetical protein
MIKSTECYRTGRSFLREHSKFFRDRTTYKIPHETYYGSYIMYPKTYIREKFYIPTHLIDKSTHTFDLLDSETQLHIISEVFQIDLEVVSFAKNGMVVKPIYTRGFINRMFLDYFDIFKRKIKKDEN